MRRYARIEIEQRKAGKTAKAVLLVPEAQGIDLINVGLVGLLLTVLIFFLVIN